MKRGRICIFFVFILLSLPFILSQTTNSSSVDSSVQDKAYDCLEEQIDSITCTKLSTTQKIFSLLTTGKCLAEVKSDSIAGCWPSNACSLKTTAQAVLALTRVSESTEQAENWLLAQNTTPSDVDWFLQVEATEAAECSVKYSGGSYNFRVSSEKKLSGTAGSCLTLSSGSWWYKISPSCYGIEFEISCDKDFLTSLLFKEKTSSTIHVSEKTSSQSAEGRTTERVDSLCLKEGGTCNYEGTLWAALALESVGYKQEINSYMPYLITQSSKNSKIIPEAILYQVTGYEEYRTNLLQKQKNNKYWDESGNKFYDTALALLPFQYSSSQEKINSMAWLSSVQEKDGCWDAGNVLSTAFLLFSLWPRQVVAEVENLDCADSKFYCMSSSNCEGDVLEEYSCASSLFVCCDTPQTFELCRNQGGYICNSDQDCIGGTEVEAGDLDSGEVCCIDGRCEDIDSVENECALNGGSCRSICGKDEQSTNYECDSTYTCCVKKTKSGIGWWIWILIILILLVILGIIFREKLRPFWEQLKSKFRKSGGTDSQIPRRPSFPPTSSSIPFRAMPRKIIPAPTNIPPKRPIMPQRPRGDLDDVLKKLKDLGK